MTETAPLQAPPPSDAAGFETLGAITGVARDGDTVTLEAGPAALRLTFLHDGVVDVALGLQSPAGYDFGDGFSYALDPTAAWPGPQSLQVEEHPDRVEILTGDLAVVASRSRLRLAFFDRAGNLLQADEAGAAWQHAGDGTVARAALSRRLRPGERILGLGDKPWKLDRRGEHFTDWNSDAFQFQRGTAPLYKAIPWILGLAENDGVPVHYGLFYDHPGRVDFDLGRTSPGRLRIQGEAPVRSAAPLRYTFVAAGTPLEVVQRFARLTGRLPLLPRWALGYHQCRYSYQNEDEIREVARELRERGFGCDALYFDIHYMDGYRVFTWDREAFPDPAGLIASLKADGFQSVVIVDPGIKADDPDYGVLQDGLAREAFVRYPGEGGAPGERFTGEVWPGLCHFPDYTRPDVRAWWGDLHAGLLKDGVAGVWNDMNEPSVFTIPGSEEDADTLPGEVRHAYEGRGAAHAEVHNTYGMQMARATYEGLKRLDPDRRPFTITRATYAGGQRFGTAWTGDNSATWDHLRLSVQQSLALNASGFPFVGSDVGGFSGVPDGELMARWTQLGAVTPLFRNHSAVDTPRQEPWLFGEEVEAICREAIALRYRLVPYLYTALEQTCRTGTPLLRALPLVHPTDETIRTTSPLGFYVGDAILAEPVLEPGQRQREVYLPEAAGWYDFYTGERLPARSTVWTETPLDRLPLYVKAGSFVPLGPARSHLGEPCDTLTLRVYPAEGTFTGTLYDDAGDGWAHESGAFARFALQGRMEGQSLKVSAERTGSYSPEWQRWQVGIPASEASEVHVDGEPVPFSVEEGWLRFEIPVGAAFSVLGIG